MRSTKDKIISLYEVSANVYFPIEVNILDSIFPEYRYRCLFGEEVVKRPTRGPRRGSVLIKGACGSVQNTLLILAFGDEDEDRCRLGVGGAARVIARVGLDRLANRQPALSWSWIGLYGHAAARGIVVYHPVIVIPEHVLRRRRALEQIEEEWRRLTSMRFNAWIFPSTKGRIRGVRGP